jgi:hypothetical protein
MRVLVPSPSSLRGPQPGRATGKREPAEPKLQRVQGEQARMTLGHTGAKERLTRAQLASRVGHGLHWMTCSEQVSMTAWAVMACAFVDFTSGLAAVR